MKRLHEWVKKFPVKKALTAIYVGAWIGGLGLVAIGAFLLGMENEGHLDYAITAVAAVAVGIIIFKSWEEYQRRIHEEHLRRIKEAIKETMWEMRQK